MRSGSSPNEISGSSGCAQATRRQVAEPVEGVDQLHVGQPQRQRVDGEVPPRQVHVDVVAERHLGLARVGHVDLGPVRRDLEDAGRPCRQPIVPKRAPCVQTSSAQPRTRRSVSSGRASVVRSRSDARPPAAAGEQRVTHRTAHQIQRATGRREAARQLLGRVDIGAEPLGHGRGLHPPTVVRPLASPCVDALGPDCPLHARRGRPPLLAGSAVTATSASAAAPPVTGPTAAAQRCLDPPAHVAGADAVGHAGPAVVQPRARRRPPPARRRTST